MVVGITPSKSSTNVQFWREGHTPNMKHAPKGVFFVSGMRGKVKKQLNIKNTPM